MGATRMVVHLMASFGLLAAVVAVGCKYRGSDGVSELSPEDRAVVTRFGFVEWHRIERAHYGRGKEHAVVVVAAKASGSSVARVVEVRDALGSGGHGYVEAMLALGVLLSSRQSADALSIHKQLSPPPRGPTLPYIHRNPAADIAAGAMISGKSAAEGRRIYEALRSDRWHSEREKGHLAFAAMVSGKSPAEVVTIFETLLDATSHAGVSGALTIGVATSGVSPEKIHQQWKVLQRQDLCGPVDAALLVGGVHYAEALTNGRNQRSSSSGPE